MGARILVLDEFGLPLVGDPDKDPSAVQIAINAARIHGSSCILISQTGHGSDTNLEEVALNTKWDIMAMTLPSEDFTIKVVRNDDLGAYRIDITRTTHAKRKPAASTKPRKTKKRGIESP